MYRVHQEEGGAESASSATSTALFTMRTAQHSSCVCISVVAPVALCHRRCCWGPCVCCANVVVWAGDRGQEGMAGDDGKAGVGRGLVWRPSCLVDVRVRATP